MSANIIMETKQLCFNYPDGTPALKDLSIQIQKGKTTGILGGNGAGKSTLFLNLNGILKPTSGQVYHKNLPISYSSKSLNQLRQSVGIVFQDPDTQLFSASVYQDVSFGVVNLGIPESEAHLRTENALKRTGTYELRQKPTHSLSYGQKKRVALAGIIAMEPEILILDEPTAGLDPQGVSEIMQLIRELQQDLGIAIIIATHDMDLVPMYCDYIYLLNQGEIVGCGSPDEIFNQPSLLRQIHLRLPRIGHLMELGGSTMSANIIMETKQLCFNYPDGTPALKDLSIQIQKGKTTGILGGNGAGKSTLFLNLNGILKPTSGQVYHKNLPISYSSKSLNQLRQSVGIVFQDPDTQLFSASVYQDVSFGVVNLGIPESEAHLRTENALKRTGTYELRQKPTHSLSYGQKKRVALAGIIAMEPEILILDEPTAGLDPQGVSEIMQLIRELQQDLGIAIIIATHDMDLVPMYCDYIYLLNQGEIVGCGSPDEIFNQPSLLRQIHLRLPRIGHLMELLKTKDGFPIEDLPVSISHARKELSRIFHLK